MTTFLWTAFVLYIFTAIVRLLCLSVLDYPVSHERAAWQDALAVVIASGFAVWAGILLFG